MRKRENIAALIMLTIVVFGTAVVVLTAGLFQIYGGIQCG